MGAISTEQASPRTPDRRVRRSRRAMQEALVSLVLERGFAAVTVETIIQRADVSRATFYAHFSDIDQLLRSVVTDLIQSLVKRSAETAPTGPNAVAKGAAISLLCQHADEHRDLYRVILSGSGNGQGRAAYTNALTEGITRVFTSLVASNNAVPRIPIDVVARSWAGSFTSLLDWWLVDSPERSVAEMADVGIALLVNGFAWSIGVEGGIDLDPRIVEHLEKH